MSRFLIVFLVLILFTSFTSGDFTSINYDNFDNLCSNDKDDLAVYGECVDHQTLGCFHVRYMSTNTLVTVQTGDSLIIVSQDYTGNGQYELGLYAPDSGGWHLINFSNFSSASPYNASKHVLNNEGGFKLSAKNGTVLKGPNYVPVPADYTGDGRVNPSLYGPCTPGNATFCWFIGDSNIIDGKFKNISAKFEIDFGYPGTTPVPADYTGDGRIDLAVFDNNTGNWYIANLTPDGSAINNHIIVNKKFGDSEYIPVPADYTGDGKVDVAVYGPCTKGNSTYCWFVGNISEIDGQNITQIDKITFGNASYIPVPGDFDNDGIADFVVYHPCSADYGEFDRCWSLKLTGNGGWTRSNLQRGSGSSYVPSTGNFFTDTKDDMVLFGSCGDSNTCFYVERFLNPNTIKLGDLKEVDVVSADYTGDGNTNFAVFNKNSRNWSILNFDLNESTEIHFNYEGIPVPADYTGDGITNIAIFNNSTKYWHIRYNDTFTRNVSFDYGGVPVPADYTGDGVANIAIFNDSTKYWYIRHNDTFTDIVHFNFEGIPVPADYTGDGVANIAIFNNSTKQWVVRNNSENIYITFNKSGIPVSLDYTGDGKSELAVYFNCTDDANYRCWEIRNISGDSIESEIKHGYENAIPVPNDFIGTSKVTWYEDKDLDGYCYSNQTRCPKDYPGVHFYVNKSQQNLVPERRRSGIISMIYGCGDCNDTNPRINPGVIEKGYALCTDGIDNSCAGDGNYDSNNVSCQLTCGDGFTELFRYKSLYLDSKSEFFGEIYTPNSTLGLTSNYSYYYPFCIKEDFIKNPVQGVCPDSSIPLFLYNSNGLISTQKDADNTFDSVFCINAKNCYIDNSCDVGSTKLLSVQSTTNSFLTHKKVISNKTLCCIADKVGIYFENYGVDNLRYNQTYLCSPFSDGICPQDFEDKDGNRIDCALFDDPDCGYVPRAYLSSEKRKEVKLNFSDRVYVLNVSNSHNANVHVVDEEGSSNYYELVFGISSDQSAVKSRTEIYFSSVDVDPSIFFDDVLFPVCEEEDELENCYLWNSTNSHLIVYHGLSDHTLRVKFQYNSIPIIALLLILLGLVLPFILIRMSRTTHKDKTTDTKKLELLKKLINQKLMNGQNKRQIKVSLIDRGFDLHLVEYAINELDKKTGNNKKLKEYIGICMNKGIPRKKIEELLLSAKWKKEDIDEAFKEIYN